MSLHFAKMRGGVHKLQDWGDPKLGMLNQERAIVMRGCVSIGPFVACLSSRTSVRGYRFAGACTY